MDPRVIARVFAAGCPVADLAGTATGDSRHRVAILIPVSASAPAVPAARAAAGSVPPAAPARPAARCASRSWWRRWLGRCWLLAGLGLCLGLWWGDLPFPGQAPPAATPAAGGTPRLVTKNIEDIRVGDRVWAHNPQLDEAARRTPDPDPATWRHLTFSLCQPDGRRVDAELLRPAEWVARQGATAGGRVYLDLPEMGCVGWATVSVGPCPPLAPGRGRVVTGTFVHRGATSVLDLRLEGLEQPIGVTANHPIYSVDRKDFVAAGELAPAERVQPAFGPPTRVVGATPRPGRHTVYNFEVHVEHVYHVSPLGLLVHNKPPDPVGPGETPQRLPSRPPNPADPQDPWHPDAVAARARAWARHYGPQQPIVWSSPAVASAARTIMGGGSTVTVGSRQEAWELYYRLFGHRGYTDTTGLSATGAKQLLGGKGGTYHWDTATDAAGRIAGHGATNPHGGMPHLQIQTETGDIIRIYFPAAQ